MRSLRSISQCMFQNRKNETPDWTVFVLWNVISNYRLNNSGQQKFESNFFKQYFN